MFIIKKSGGSTSDRCIYAKYFVAVPRPWKTSIGRADGGLLINF